MTTRDTFERSAINESKKYMKVNTLAVLTAMAIGISLLFAAHTAYAQNVIYVTKSGSPAPTGEQSAPYHVIEAAIVRAKSLPGSTVVMGPGKYYETFTVDTPVSLKATGGTVTIGMLDYKASTTLEIITLNTHLFGDVIGPSWMDDERKDDIARFIAGMNPKPHVVGFQEIWDEDLFFGDDETVGILNQLGGLYGGGHGTGTDCLICINSGLAIMSPYQLLDLDQAFWNDCDGSLPTDSSPDCLASKGWLQATINKDGFSIGLFDLHTQAGEDSDQVDARFNQIVQLKNAISTYRAEKPNHVVFVMGDFNIYGEKWEYYNTLISRIGFEVGGMDADRNSPGFVIGPREQWLHEQWTLCDCNPLAMYFDDETKSGRLDYIFYFPSRDGSVEVIPTAVRVLQFRGRNHCCIYVPFFPFVICQEDMERICVTNPLTSDPICLNAFCTRESSDHWSVYGQFKLIRP